MKELQLNALNSLHFSERQTEKLQFSVCWISLTCEDNTEHLILRAHHHAFFELHYIMEGSMEYEIAGQRVILNRGDYVLLPPHQVHNIVRRDGTFAKLSAAFHLSQDSELCADLSPSVVKGRHADAQMEDTVKRILENATQKSLYRTELVLHSVREWILRVAQDHGGVYTPDSAENEDGRVRKAKMLIEDNTDVLFTCEEIARYCHVSVKQLGRLFQKYENMGLLEYIHFQKAESAKRLLTELNATPSHVARLLGFSDARYFAKFFLREVGVTPSQYRTLKG